MVVYPRGLTYLHYDYCFDEYKHTCTTISMYVVCVVQSSHHPLVKSFPFPAMFFLSVESLFTPAIVHTDVNPIGGVMIIVLPSSTSVVDRGV